MHRARARRNVRWSMAAKARQRGDLSETVLRRLADSRRRSRAAFGTRMNPAGRTQAVIELYDAIEASNAPADRVANGYFRARRYIGSSDRRAVSLHLWRLLRRRARLDWWLKSKGAPTDPRRRLLADYVFEAEMTMPELTEIFSGVEHAPERLSGDERALIDSLRGFELIHRGMPVWVRAEFPEFLAPGLDALYGPALEAEMEALLEPAPV